MTETPKTQAPPDSADPSMEDILASIRRILNEEEAPAAPEAGEETPVDDDVLVLDQSMMVAAGQPDPQAIDEPVAPAPKPPMATAEPPPQDTEVLETPPQPQMPVLLAQTSELVAPEAAAAAASSVSNLMRTLAAGRSTQVYSGGPTLEDIVRAELRPLLKEWLDENLPALVERLVRAEIERVVGRAVP
jgi:cell pole-organizing protein PopZ